MFQNDRYTTRGIRQNISEKNPVTYLLLWDLIDQMEVAEKDCIQIFELHAKFGEKNLQEIKHTQEELPYEKIREYYFTANPVDAKIYVVDDGEESVMLLEEEYKIIYFKTT